MSQQQDSVTVIAQLTQTLHQRRSADADSSYVASLYQAGLDKILEKVGEEATEVIIAAKTAQTDATATDACVAEVADLWFHSMVLLHQLDREAQDVLDVLAQRFGIGGHEEKANRDT